MLKNYYLLFLIPFFALVSCKKEGYKKTTTGLEYKYIVDSAGTTPQPGEAILLDVMIRDPKDSVLEHTFGTTALIEQPRFQGGLEEGFMMLSPGDSASFKISADSFFNVNLNKELPPFLKKGSDLTFNIKLHKIYSKEEVAAEMEKYKKLAEEDKQNKIAAVDNFIGALLDSASIQKQMKTDEIVINGYIKENNLSMQRTSNGVYYNIKEDSGKENAKPGDTLTVHYTGKTLDGNVFDSSEGRAPYTFILGTGEVIPGWDDVMKNFAEGDKGSFIIPSPLGYMDIGIPKQENPEEYLIPKNAPLYFDVEIVEVRK